MVKLCLSGQDQPLPDSETRPEVQSLTSNHLKPDCSYDNLFFSYLIFTSTFYLQSWVHLPHPPLHSHPKFPSSPFEVKVSRMNKNIPPGQRQMGPTAIS